MTRLLAALAVVLAALGLGVPPAGAAGDAGAEAEFVDRVNGARSSAGRGALTTDGELTSIARRWSQRMANEQRLSHNPNLANEVKADWEKLAENVGFGQTVGQIHDAFMDSAAHRNNILDGAMTHIGVGVVVDGAGQIWVTQVFMRLRGGGSSPSTTAAPPPPPPTSAAPPPTSPPPTSPPTTRAPRVTTATTARPAPASMAPTTAPPGTAPPTTPPPDPGPAPVADPAAVPRTPTARLVLVLDGLRALDQRR